MDDDNLGAGAKGAGDADSRAIHDVIDAAKRAGLSDLAVCLDFMHRNNNHEFFPMDPDSAGSLVSFLSKYGHGLPMPHDMGVNVDGEVHVDWTLTEEKDITVQFMPSGEIWFAYLDLVEGGEFRSVDWQGVTTPDEMFKKIALLPEDIRPSWGVLAGAESRTEAAANRTPRQLRRRMERQRQKRQKAGSGRSRMP